MRAAAIVVATLSLAVVPSATVAQGTFYCGTAVTQLDAPYWAVDSVESRGVDCARARNLAREWDARSVAGEIPAGVFSGPFDHYGPSYSLGGFSCRHKAEGSDIASVRCLASNELVLWGFHRSTTASERPFYQPLETARTCPGFLLGPDPVDLITQLSATNVLRDGADRRPWLSQPWYAVRRPPALLPQRVRL